jgi:hypothetical protein
MRVWWFVEARRREEAKAERRTRGRRFLSRKRGGAEQRKGGGGIFTAEGAESAEGRRDGVFEARRREEAKAKRRTEGGGFCRGNAKERWGDVGELGSSPGYSPLKQGRPA